MARNETWKKVIKDGKEHMELIESIEVPDIPIELQGESPIISITDIKINELKKELDDLKSILRSKSIIE